MRKGTETLTLWCRNGNVFSRSSSLWAWDEKGSAWARHYETSGFPVGNYELRFYLAGRLAQAGKFTIEKQPAGETFIGAIRFAEGQEDDNPVNLHTSGQNFKYGLKAVYAFFEVWYEPQSYTRKSEWYRNGALEFQKSTQYSSPDMVDFSWSSHFREDQSPLESGNYELRLYIDNRLVKSGTFVIQ
jgi:hypothetical protein